MRPGLPPAGPTSNVVRTDDMLPAFAFEQFRARRPGHRKHFSRRIEHDDPPSPQLFVGKQLIEPCAGWPAMRARTSASHSCGSTAFILQVTMKSYRFAARRPPRSRASERRRRLLSWREPRRTGGWRLNRKRVRRLMRPMGIKGLVPHPGAHLHARAGLNDISVCQKMAFGRSVSR